MRAMVAVCGAALLCGCASRGGVPAGPGKEGASVSEAAPAAGPAAGVLATIGDTVITEGDLAERIKAMPPRVVGRFQSPAGKKNLLNSLVEMELLYREACKEGLDKEKETLDRLEEFRKRLAAERLRERVLEAVKVDEDELRKEYEKDGVRHKTQKQVRVSQIVLSWDANSTPAVIDGIKKNAESILDRAKKGEEFAELAKKYSLDQASAAKGGDIGYATRRTLSPEAYKAALGMDTAGALSGVIEGKDEVRILKATEVIPERKKPFEEVRPWLERVVQSRKQREAWLAYVAELKRKEGVVVHEERLGPAAPDAGGGRKSLMEGWKTPVGAKAPAAPERSKAGPGQIKLGPSDLNKPSEAERPQGVPIKIELPAGAKPAPAPAPASGAM